MAPATNTLLAAAVAVTLLACVPAAYAQIPTGGNGTSPLLPGFANLPWGFEKTDMTLKTSSGTVPSWLAGTLHRIGPVRYTLEPAMANVAHW